MLLKLWLTNKSFLNVPLILFHSMEKIIIAAANGYLGRLLAKHFANKDFEVIGLCRKSIDLDNARCVVWDGKTLNNWAKELEGATALINLAGKSVDCRYTDENKRLILASRVESTEVIGKAIAQCSHPPKVWLNAGSATIYHHAEDAPMDEETGEIGKGFSVNICKTWESTFFNSDTPNIKKVALRISFVLGNSGGAYPMLKKLAKFGLGGTLGKGNQYISWIHEIDFCNSVEWLINNGVEGVVNITAPNPQPNKIFMQQIRKNYKIPFGLPQPKWLLEIGAILIGTETELILKSRRVVPTRLLKGDFKFQYPNLKEAIKSFK